MAREANLDTNPNAADAPDAHDAPPAAGDDDESNPPDQEGDYAPDNLNNLDAIIRRDMIAMYVHVLGFKEGAAIALYNNQQITNLDPLCELNDPTIKKLCRQIGKEGHPVSMISQNCLKLLIFWAKHMWRTLCGVDDLSKINYDKDIKHLQAQKTFEDSLDDSKEPDAPKMTLTLATAAASFTQMKTHLAKCRGTTGLPLEYVVRPQLKGPHDVPEDGPEDSPPFGDPNSPYATINAELTARAPILRFDLTHAQLAQPLDYLKEHGPFDPTFVQDSAKVYDILHTTWGTSQPWTHARSATAKTKNERKAFRVLHTHLLGGQQLVTSGSAIMTRLQSLQYDDDRRNINFNKYVALHVAGHNNPDDLGEYGVEPLTKSLKILWFQKGITDKSLDAVRTSILAAPASYTTFTAVQEAYVNFKLTQKATEPPKARQVASMRAGRRTGMPRCSGGGRGQGGGDRKKNLPSKVELDACTVENREYADEEYKRLTPAQKHKLWMLRNPNQTPGSGPTRHSRGSSIASTSLTGTKRAADASHDGDTSKTDNPWGKDRSGNRDNKAVAGRQHVTKSQKTGNDK
jgi:hypothetical protein